MSTQNKRAGSDGRRSRVTRPGRGHEVDRNREERRTEKARGRKANPGAREMPETDDATETATLAVPNVSAELACILASTPRDVRRGDPKAAGVYVHEVILPNLGGLGRNARNARYEYLTGLYKVGGLLRHLVRDPDRQRAFRRALKLVQRKTVYLELLHAIGPPPAEDGSGERKRVLDRYSDYNRALVAAEEEGLRPEALLARLVDDQGIQKLVEAYRAKKRQEDEAGDDDGAIGAEVQDRSSQRRDQREQQAAKAAVADQFGVGFGPAEGRSAEDDGVAELTFQAPGTPNTDESDRGLGVVQAADTARSTVLSSRGKHGGIIVIKGPPGGPVTVTIKAATLMRLHRFGDDQEALAHMISSVHR